jgi:hypothetical protein
MCWRKINLFVITGVIEGRLLHTKPVVRIRIKRDRYVREITKKYIATSFPQQGQSACCRRERDETQESQEGLLGEESHYETFSNTTRIMLASLSDTVKGRVLMQSLQALVELSLHGWS